jgi:hypothetical protein
MGYPKRVGACVLLRFPAAPNLSFPRFACGPLEMLNNFVKSCEAIAGSSAATGEASREC